MANTIIRLNNTNPGLSLYDKTTSAPRAFLNGIIDYLNGMNGGLYTASLEASLDTSGVKATGTVTAAAVQAADTVTLQGTVFTAAQLNATGTVTAASVAAADTVTVNGIVLTARASGAVAFEFNIGGSDTATATNIVSAINTYVSGSVSASSSAAVVTIRAVTQGTSGNSITLASSNGTRLAVSGATLSGGAAAVGNQFDYVGTNTNTAASLANAINTSATAVVIDNVTASSSGAICTIQAIAYGKIGNVLTLASSNGTRLAVSAATLTGGVNVVYKTYSYGV